MVLWYICFVLDVHGSFFFTSNYYICPSFSLPPSRSSHTGLHSRLCSPPSHNGSCLAFFTARRFQLSIPSSTQVELCLPTLGGLSSCLFFFIFFFLFPSHLLSSPFCSLPPSRNSDLGSHNRLFSPLSTTVRALHFYREKNSALSSLVDSRRIVLLPTIGALSS